jgi:hypothetical protein
MSQPINMWGQAALRQRLATLCAHALKLTLFLETGYLAAWHGLGSFLILIGPGALERDWFIALGLSAFGAIMAFVSYFAVGLSIFGILKCRTLIKWSLITLSVFTGTVYSSVIYAARNDFPPQYLNYFPIASSVLLLINTIAVFHSVSAVDQPCAGKR